MIFHDIAVAGIVVNGNKILIMKRSKERRHYPGVWDFPCETMKDGSLAENAVRGIGEEAGLRVEVVRRGKPITLEDGEWKFVVVPVLCKTDSRNVRMDEEHNDFRWVSIDEIKEYDMIHYTEDALKALGLVR